MCVIFVAILSEGAVSMTYEQVISYIEELFYVLWYKHFLGTRWGTFFSCGVVRYQLNALWIDVIILIILYFYLEFFSFTIYETENVEKQKKSFEKYNFQFSSSFIFFIMALELVLLFVETPKCLTRNLPQPSSSIGFRVGPSTIMDETAVPCS